MKATSNDPNGNTRKTPHEKLADSLEKLAPTLRDGIYRSGQLSQRDFSRVFKAGYLIEIIKGWYHASSPFAPSGITIWHGHYWPFVRQYLESRYGVGYCLAAEPSLLIHAGLTSVPKQIYVLTETPSNNKLDLPHGHSLVAYQERSGLPTQIEAVSGLRVMTSPYALSRASESFFREYPTQAAALLFEVRDPSPILRQLLERGATVYAGRLAGAFRHIGFDDFANRIAETMKRIGYEVSETNPFNLPIPKLGRERPISPYVPRLKILWAQMRRSVIDAFPTEPGLPASPKSYLDRMSLLSTLDAYHSLSIEGYQVDQALIERVRNNKFNAKEVAKDKEALNALAARGYYEAFQAVTTSIEKILKGSDPAETVRSEHHDWYDALFQVAVQAGFHEKSELAGYRGHQVFINGADHVPLPPNAVIDAMETLFELIAVEPHAAARAVLGHFIFVYIHPYGDGNGRMGRFLMNALFASGGYPWTVIHVDDRKTYMNALAKASTEEKIDDFAKFVAGQMERTMTE